MRIKQHRGVRTKKTIKNCPSCIPTHNLSLKPIPPINKEIRDLKERKRLTKEGIKNKEENKEETQINLEKCVNPFTKIKKTRIWEQKQIKANKTRKYKREKNKLFEGGHSYSRKNREYERLLYIVDQSKVAIYIYILC